jgi:transposase
MMIWGIFSWYGGGELHVCIDNMNAKRYIDILRTKAIPQMTEWFNNISNGIFMQDNAPSHTATIVKSFLAESNFRVLDWPGNSPDINPIENLWAIVKSRLALIDIKNKEELITNILNIWNNDKDIKKCMKSLIESMPKRIAALRKSRGKHTKY